MKISNFPAHLDEQFVDLILLPFLRGKIKTSLHTLLPADPEEEFPHMSFLDISRGDLKLLSLHFEPLKEVSSMTGIDEVDFTGRGWVSYGFKESPDGLRYR